MSGGSDLIGKRHGSQETGCFQQFFFYVSKDCPIFIVAMHEFWVACKYCRLIAGT